MFATPVSLFWKDIGRNGPSYWLGSKAKLKNKSEIVKHHFSASSQVALLTSQLLQLSAREQT